MDRFDDLVLLIEVVDSGSLSVAGERLGLSPSSVSRRLTQIEERLGTRLLIRTTRRIALTDVGAVFCHRARTILAALDDAERAVSETSGKPRGTLSIACPAAFGQIVLAPLLPGFMAQYEEVALDVRLSDGTGDSGADIALCLGRVTDTTMIARRLAPLRHAVLGSPAYFERKGRPMAPSDLPHHDCLPETRGGVRVDWEFVVGGLVDTMRISGRLQSENPLILRAAALDGQGLVRLPICLVGAEVEAGLLQPVLASFEVQDTSVYATYLASRHLSPRVRAFVDFIGPALAGRLDRPS